MQLHQEEPEDRHGGAAMRQRWVDTGTEAVAGLLRLRPELATELGDHTADDRLDDLSDAGLSALRSR